MHPELTVPALEHAFDVVVELGTLEDHGTTRAGWRRVVPIVGGTISGGLDAEILAGGADWQLVRPDGAIEIDGRYSARTTSGELLYLRVSGVRSGTYFRTGITIETSSPRLADLQDSVFVASCVREATTVRYAAYRVS